MGMLANKEPAGLLAPIAPLVEKLIAVPTPNHEHYLPESLAEIATGLGVPSQTAPDIASALRAIATSGAPAHVLVLGSLYLAGEVLRLNDEQPT